MDPSRRSSMGSIGSSQGDCLSPRSTPRHQVQQLSTVSYGGRPPSAQSSIRPSTGRSTRSIRPGTPGGSIGLSVDLKVESRPVTKQGMMSSRSSFQGPGRQVLDKSYYVSRLMAKKQELQIEIDSMSGEIERLQRQGPATLHLEHKQEALTEEVKVLKAQLGDYNMVMEKVAAGLELDQLRELLRSAKEKNDLEKRMIDHLFNERTQKEKNAKEAEEKVQVLEAEMEDRFSQEDPESKVQYSKLHGEACMLAADVDRMETELQDIAWSVLPLEQELMKCGDFSPKQRAVALLEQLLGAEEELERLKLEDLPAVHLSPEEARSFMLLKIRQDNVDIAKAQEKSKELEANIHEYKERISAADRSFSELKGGRAERFLEMQQKEKKMQAFIDNFEGMRHEHGLAALRVQQRIIQVLQHISQGAGTGPATGAGLLEDINELLRVMEERRGELKQLEDMEEKTVKEVASIKDKKTSLQSEIDKFNQLEDLRTQSETKCAKLEEEKKKADVQKKLLQVQLKEQIAKMEFNQSTLNENEMHMNLNQLNERLANIQQTVTRVQEEVELKERETNYKPVLENIRFMVGQLNTETRAHQLH